MLSPKALRSAIFFSLFICLSVSVFAVGISPGVEKISILPGYERTIGYRATNPGATGDTYIKIGLKRSENPIVQYIKFPEEDTLLVPKGGSAPFSVHISLPDPLPENLVPGQNDLYVGVSDVEGQGGGAISVFSNTYALLRINVPYPGRYVNLHLSAQDVASGQSARIVLSINSQGKQTIQRATATIDIYSDQNRVLSLPAKSVSNIQTTETKEIAWSIDAVTLPVGLYRAVAHVEYDGEAKDIETTFRVGTPDLNIINFTQSLEAGAIRTFDVHVQSVWNNNLHGAYADVTISKSGNIISNVKTPSTDIIGPWKEEKLTGYIDTTSIEPGTYAAEVNVLFNQGKKTESGIVTITPAGSSEMPGFAGTSPILMAIGVLAVIMLVLIAILLYKSSKRQH